MGSLPDRVGRVLCLLHCIFVIFRDVVRRVLCIRTVVKVEGLHIRHCSVRPRFRFRSPISVLRKRCIRLAFTFIPAYIFIVGFLPSIMAHVICSCMFSPTPGRSISGSIPSGLRIWGFPIPESSRICGDFRALKFYVSRLCAHHILNEEM